jgi:hypothetical protein
MKCLWCSHRRLSTKLTHLNHLCRRGDFRPTEQAYQVKETLTREVMAQLDRYNVLRGKEIPKLNELVRSNAVNAVHLEKKALFEH